MFVFAFFSAVCSRPRHHELVAGTAPACLLAREDAVLHQVADIPQGGVLGAFADEGPLRGVYPPPDRLSLFLEERKAFMQWPSVA